MSLINALKWSLVSELTAKAIQPVVFIILARILTPEDFGVITAAMMVIAFSQIFWEAGMGKALIQRQSKIEAAANTAFWINITLGIAISGLLYLLAGPIARIFFHDERVAIVLQVMTLQILLGSFSSVHSALLQKELAFKKLFWVRFATVGLPGMASIPLAFCGWGYWALVSGTLIGSLAQVIMLWRLSAWAPSWQFDLKIAREVSAFGFWVGLTAIFSWFYQWVDSLILGLYFGLKEVGIFRIGNQFSMTIFALIFAFILPAIYASFSKDAAMADKVKIRTKLNLVSINVSILSLPIGLMIYILSADIERFVFGGDWVGVGFVIGLIAIKEAVLWIFAFNIEAIRAMGKPKPETLVAGLSGLANILVLYFFVQHGFGSFMFGRSIVLMLIGLLINLAMYLYIFGLEDTTYKKILIYIAAFLSLALLIFLVELFFNKSIFIKIFLLAIPIIFFVILSIQNKRSIRSIVNNFRANYV